MKRFRFPLDRMLRLKQQKKRQAELHQAKTLAALDAARSEIALIQNALSRTASAIESCVGESAEARHLIARQQHAAMLGQAIEAAEQRQCIVAKVLQEADQARKRAATEVEVLTTLEGRRWQDHRQEMIRQTQQLNDELSLRRWHEQRSLAGQPDRSGREVWRT